MNDDTELELLYDLSEVFRVFGDTTRIRLLSALRAGPLCVSCLSEELEMQQSAVSHQLRMLRSAGLVRPTRMGKNVSYALDDEHVASILDLGLSHVTHRRAGYQYKDDKEEA
ncbi:MAG: metalloregulator ArsR/SmtB family transcription factor [Oscillospiraceae bacterium]|jgi:ArsR family transcriptional regulator|nr:metalloregulator ArsR/SmtB family transcription factor [Oscillospiraceae bacterium]